MPALRLSRSDGRAALVKPCRGVGVPCTTPVAMLRCSHAQDHAYDHGQLGMPCVFSRHTTGGRAYDDNNANRGMSGRGRLSPRNGSFVWDHSMVLQAKRPLTPYTKIPLSPWKRNSAEPPSCTSTSNMLAKSWSIWTRRRIHCGMPCTAE